MPRSPRNRGPNPRKKEKITMSTKDIKIERRAKEIYQEVYKEMDEQALVTREGDLSPAQQAIKDFIDAYNNLRPFQKEQMGLAKKTEHYYEVTKFDKEEDLSVTYRYHLYFDTLTCHHFMWVKGKQVRVEWSDELEYHGLHAQMSKAVRFAEDQLLESEEGKSLYQIIARVDALEE